MFDLPCNQVPKAGSRIGISLELADHKGALVKRRMDGRNGY